MQRIFVLALALTFALAGAAAADQVCPRCEKPVPGEYRFCPFDGTEIPDPTCARCERKMRREWKFCPFDATDLVAAAARHAPAASPAPLPAPVDPKAPLVETLPRPGAPPAETRLPANLTQGERRSRNPYDTVEDLFRAISTSDEAWIRKLYAWPRFFPQVAEADMEAKIDGYVKRLIERVKPTLAGRERFLSDIALGKTDATLKIQLRDVATRTTVTEYEFKLVDDGKGWWIVAIKP